MKLKGHAHVGSRYSSFDCQYLAGVGNKANKCNLQG